MLWNIFQKKKEKDYTVSLHYFNDFISHGIEDVPNNLKEPNEEMQMGPNMNDIIKYSNDGYIQMMNIIANYILKDTYNDNAFINYGLQSKSMIHINLMNLQLLQEYTSLFSLYYHIFVHLFFMF